MKKNILYVIAFSVILFSCNQSSNNDKKITETDTVKIKVPYFNEDSAYNYVKKQVDFGPRVPNSKEHILCGNYLVSELKKYSDTVIEQKAQVKNYAGKNLNMRNIIASFQTEKQARVILCAHWDSRAYADQDADKNNHNKPILGANDGASGVGVLLEIARLLKNNKANIGIDIILFDAEDDGPPHNSKYENIDGDWWCLGSQYWSKNMHKPFYSARFAILLDMVGAKDAVFAKEGVSMHFAPDVVNKVWNTAKRIGYSNYFIDKNAPSITDDHLYLNQLTNIPSIDIIQYDQSSSSNFYKHWHTVKDDMDGIDKNTLKAVGQTVLQVVFEEK